MMKKMHESKAEHRMAGRKGEKKEPEKAKAKGGRDSHHKRKAATKMEHGMAGHGAEHKMAEVHVHHHHHHHHGGMKK
jgi:hypothetical protein